MMKISFILWQVIWVFEYRWKVWTFLSLVSCSHKDIIYDFHCFLFSGIKGGSSALAKHCVLANFSILCTSFHEITKSSGLQNGRAPERHQCAEPTTWASRGTDKDCDSRHTLQMDIWFVTKIIYRLFFLLLVFTFYRTLGAPPPTVGQINLSKWTKNATKCDILPLTIPLPEAGISLMIVPKKMIFGHFCFFLSKIVIIIIGRTSNTTGH